MAKNVRHFRRNSKEGENDEKMDGENGENCIIFSPFSPFRRDKSIKNKWQMVMSPQNIFQIGGVIIQELHT